jgi:hypothetical protein
VNWLEITITNAEGKQTYRNSFVTSLPVGPDTVEELAACARARWRIENETFNVLKNGGYHLEHNFGHGRETLCQLLVTLNLLAFAMHEAAATLSNAWTPPAPLSLPNTASSKTSEPSQTISSSIHGANSSIPSQPAIIRLSNQPHRHNENCWER